MTSFSSKSVSEIDYFSNNLVSFHASSRLILHADVFYIIDIAYH